MKFHFTSSQGKLCQNVKNSIIMIVGPDELFPANKLIHNIAKHTLWNSIGCSATNTLLNSTKWTQSITFTVFKEYIG